MPIVSDVSKRRLQPELMDAPELEAARHLLALRGLARVNQLSLTARSFWSAIRPLAASAGRPLRVLDIACGGGDVTMQLCMMAQRSGHPLVVDGCDISQRALDHAQSLAEKRGAASNFFRFDAIKDDLPRGYDVVVSSLFLHHLELEHARRLLANMAQAGASLVLVSDLIRCRTGLFLAHATCRAISRSEIVHHDGPRSVESAFTIEEVKELAASAGMADARIAMRWPLRFLLDWRPPQ
jgi:2-polyprenyl-3-methyl-5-hydroxy-6-metoxy-1,4-benzoquinol methylase